MKIGGRKIMTQYPPRLVLSSGRLTVELLPEWGGKMISFRTEPDGYEFLAPAPFGPHRPDAAIFAPEDAYGFDDMFPGVYPQPYPRPPWQQEQIADHGDLWYRPWSYSGGGSAATLAVEDSRFDWRFSKSLHFNGPLALQIEYRLDNGASQPLFWLYSAHILCSFRAGIELELPAGLYRCLETFGQPLPEAAPAQAAYLRRWEAFPPGSAAFYMSEEIGPASCRYRDRQADKALRLSWSRPLAYLGLWYNTGGWLGEKPVVHLGLEPATAGHQNLAEWLKTGAPAVLPAGDQVTWSLTMAVEEMAGG
jgi:hypothetical protein